MSLFNKMSAVIKKSRRRPAPEATAAQTAPPTGKAAATPEGQPPAATPLKGFAAKVMARRRKRGRTFAGLLSR